MAVPYSRGAALAGARSSPSALSGSRSFLIGGFPKSARILRSADFRKVYDGGSRFSGPLFTAFCLRETAALPSPMSDVQPSGRLGFTVSRKLGRAVHRNRMKRRLREAVRSRLELLDTDWMIVFNPRPRVLDAPFSEVLGEVERLFQRCKG
ncbi:MAG: ribonuclease P protein component [Bryobacteraceae bacterium]